MDCEVDLLLLATTVLKEFGLSDYRFVLNHRKILEAQLLSLIHILALSRRRVDRPSLRQVALAAALPVSSDSYLPSCTPASEHARGGFRLTSQATCGVHSAREEQDLKTLFYRHALGI